MRPALAVLLLTLLGPPALAADPAETACLYAMAERLPKLPGLRIARAELAPGARGIAWSAPAGERRRIVGGHIVTELGGVESTYAVTCSLLIGRQGGISVEPGRSTLRPAIRMP
jgi:hypothetical protein